MSRDLDMIFGRGRDGFDRYGNQARAGANRKIVLAAIRKLTKAVDDYTYLATSAVVDEYAQMKPYKPLGRRAVIGHLKALELENLVKSLPLMNGDGSVGQYSWRSV